MSQIPDSSMRVLIIEDDEAIQTLMDAVFRDHPVVVDHAYDGETALNLLRRSCYDVIVLDLMLPGRNGFEVIREIRVTRPEILSRTIVLTAASDSTLRDFAEASSVRRLIRKPFDLIDFVQEVLSCGSVTRSGTPATDRRAH